MNHIEAQKLIDEKVALSYQEPLYHLLEWVRSIYVSVGIPVTTSQSLRASVHAHYKTNHRDSIKTAIKNGIAINKDVIEDYLDIRHILNRNLEKELPNIRK